MLEFICKISRMLESVFRSELIDAIATSQAMSGCNRALLSEPHPRSDAKGVLNQAVKGTLAQAQRAGDEFAPETMLSHET